MISPNNPTRLDIRGSNSLLVGSCSSAFTLYAEDSNANFAPVNANTNVTLSAGGSFNFYSDSSCTTLITNISILNGSSSAIFYAKDTVNESTLMVANASGFLKGSLSINVNAQNPSKFVLTGASSVGSSVCSGAIFIKTYDSFGNLAPVSTSTVVALAGKGAGTFYSGSNCTGTITSLTLTPGVSIMPFYFKDATVESLLFTANSAGFSAGSFALNVSSSAATKLAVTGALPNITSGCMGPFTVTAKDAGSNATNVSSAVQVNLTQTLAATFYATSACSGSVTSVTIASGTSSQNFYMMDATAQTVTVTGTDNAAVLTASTLAGVVFSTSGLTVTGPAAATLATCTGPYTVTNINGAGAATNVASAKTVTLAGNGSGTFYTAAGCGTSATTLSIALGTSAKTFYFQDATSENLTFSLTAASTAKGTLAVTSGTPLPTKMVLTGAASIVSASCNAYTVTSQNAASVTSAVASNTALSFAGTGSGAIYSDAACTIPAASPQINSGSSSAVYYLKDTALESLTFQAIATGLTSASLTISVTAGNPTQLKLTGPDQIPRGLCSAVFTVSSLDVYRNPAAVGTNVTLNLSGAGAGAFYSDASCTTPVTLVQIANGTSSTGFYFKDSTGETLTFTATDGTTSLGSIRSSIVTISGTTMVAAGRSYSCAVVNSELWCWGTYQLFGPNSVSSATPQKIGGLGAVSSVSITSAGYNGVTCILVSGAVKCWGNGWAANGYGAIGNNSANPNYSPTIPAGLSSGVTSIVSSSIGNHICAIQAGALFCWGNNNKGQIGNNSTTNALVPTQVTGLTANVTSVSTGVAATCAVVSGVAYCWGDNSTRQLGDGTANATSSVPVPVVGITGTVSQIAIGSGHACAVTTAGALYCWGQSSHGELGNNSTSTQPTAILVIASGVSSVIASVSHTCAIVSGVAQCWGSNGGGGGDPNGQVGNNSVNNQYVPANVVNLQSGATQLSATDTGTCAIVNGSVFCWGNSLNGQMGMPAVVQSNIPLPVVTLSSQVTNIAATSGTSACAVVSGAAKCWGSGSSSKLGNGSTLYVTSPSQVTSLTSGVTQIVNGYTSGCSLVSGGVQCWGAGLKGELGINAIVTAPTPVPVTGLSSGVSAISMGPTGRHLCALMTADGSVNCWGGNPYGQIGDGSLIDRWLPTAVSGLTGMTAISVGGNHSCALASSGAVYCWGYNSNGQLGDGTLTNSSVPLLVQGLPSTISAISAGTSHTCALTLAGSIYCWGANSGGVNNVTGAGVNPLGQLGNNSGIDSLAPVQVQSLGGVAVQVTAGEGETCAVLQNGLAQCWGNNYNSQLGIGPVNVNTFLPQYVSGLSGITSISLGSACGCAIASGGMYCWGNNWYQQLGQGGAIYTAVPVEVQLP